MPQTPVDNTQASLALTQSLDINSVFPPHPPNGHAGGAFMGEIFTYAFDFSPLGATLDANGDLLPINQNQAVFSLLGTTYGGDGKTTFALPDLRGVTKISTGQGPGLGPEDLGVPDGASSVTLTLPELPPDLGGTSQAFSNYQLSLPVTYMINVGGIFPSQGGGGTSRDMLGQVMPFAGNFVPTDYLPADGRLLQINAQNAALFSLIGTIYGGDGMTTFALPDLRGRTIVGASMANPLGALIGSPTVSLTNSQAPNGFGNVVQPFENREPSLALNYLISVNGIFPSKINPNVINPDTPFLGEVMPFAGNFAPSGWALANGQLLPINQNQALFALLGTTYGGDGAVTFALPDLRGRTVIGTGNGIMIGSQLGANFPTVTAAELPTAFALPTFQLSAFGPNAGGWSSDDAYPRAVADVNGGGMADIVGFSQAGVFESLATGGGAFVAPTFELAAFGTNAGGWSSNDTYPRTLADVNGDHMADIVGFSQAGVFESLATPGGHFAAPTFELAAFGVNAGGWSSDNTYPRALADVNGDGMADIVGFSQAGVFESLADASGHFAAPTFELAAFGTNAGGWSSNDTYPRALADVNGDGSADIVGFGQAGVYVSLATGGGHFAMPTFELAAFGAGAGAGGWTSQDLYPRTLADVNGDGMADIVGFGAEVVSVSLATGGGHFASPTSQLLPFSPSFGGWSSDTTYPRQLADINGNGTADIVGFASNGVWTSPH
jgi:microcystin-dependent protein